MWYCKHDDGDGEELNAKECAKAIAEAEAHEAAQAFVASRLGQAENGRRGLVTKNLCFNEGAAQVIRCQVLVSLKEEWCVKHSLEPMKVIFFEDEAYGGGTNQDPC